MIVAGLMESKYSIEPSVLLYITSDAQDSIRKARLLAGTR